MAETLQAGKWWRTTAMFAGDIAGKFVRFDQGNYIFGNYEAAAWSAADIWFYIDRDGRKKAERSFDSALRLASGASIDDARCPTCGGDLRA